VIERQSIRILAVGLVAIVDLAMTISTNARGHRVHQQAAQVSSTPVPTSAIAHTVGGPCQATVENCEKWSVTVQGPPRSAGQRPDEFPDAVAVDSTTVFAGVTAVNFDTSDPYSSTASWTLAAYDINTGAERWRVFRRSRVYDSLHGVAVSPDGGTVVATGGAYDAFPVGATDSRIVTVGYDATTGVERWSATWDNNPAGTDNGVIVHFSPDGRSVYVGGVTAPTPGELDYVTISYDAIDGTQQWVSIYKGLGNGGTNALFDLAVSPDGKQVYVTGESAGASEYELDYATVAYDASSGVQLWASRSQPTFVDRASCLAADHDHVYVSGDSYTGPNGGDYQALTVALRASDGSVDWQRRLGGSGYNGARAIAAGGGRVVVTTQSPSTGPDEGLTALTAAYDAKTGQDLWVRPLAEPLRSQLANDLAIAPDGNHVYLVASSRPHIPDTALDDQEVIAYDLANGSIAWSVHLDSGPANALTGDKVVVAPGGNSLFTLGQITRSADPLGSADQNIYDSLVVALPAVSSPIPGPTPTATPTMLASTYLGGGGGPGDYDITWTTATDANGNVYIAGDSDVADFPVTANALQKTYAGGGQDGFVAKFDKNGNLLWSTFLGGSGWDGVYSLAVDANGDAVVTGVTESSDFPITANAIQNTVTGDAAFVTVISADGTSVLYSTFLGGTISDGGVPLPVNLFHLNPNANVETIGVGIAVGPDGTLYVAGETNTIDMPITQNAAQSIIGGEFDGFVARIDTTKEGSAGLIYSTYLGGATGDFCAAVTVDSTGNAFVTGETQSPNFPVTVGAFQSFHGPGTAGFVAKLSPDGTKLIYSTLLSGSQGSSAAGGTNYNAPSAIVIDSSGHAFVVGETNASDFPTTAGVVQPIFAGQDDGFVTEFSADGSSLIFSTYLGASDYDGLFGVKLDASGNIFVGGYSASRDLPLVLPFQSNFGGYYDGWVAELSPGGTTLLFSSFLGGNDQDSVYGLGLWNNQLCLGGRTASTNFPITENASQKIYGGGVWDNFLTIVDLSGATPTPTPVPVQLSRVVSRATHGTAGTFDVDLMSDNGIECRSSGANGGYTVVFSFTNTLTTVGRADVTSGVGSVATSAIDSNDSHNYVVNLTGVANAQAITVTLSNVTDSAGNFSSSVPATMRVLIGDTTGNGFVNSSDIAQTQSQSGQAVTANNFREDVTVNGLINSSDISLVQSQSGTALR